MGESQQLVQPFERVFGAYLIRIIGCFWKALKSSTPLCYHKKLSLKNEAARKSLPLKRSILERLFRSFIFLRNYFENGFDKYDIIMDDVNSSRTRDQSNRMLR